MTIGYQAQSFETELSDKSLDKKRERHKELSITVRRTMYVMLAYSASCGVIIAQPDVPFVLTSSGVQIPIINVAVNLKAFLVVGPLGLVVLTAYLHLFLAKLEKLEQIFELDKYDKQPFLFNFQDRFSRLLAFLIFYATPPLVMVAFSWKSAVIRGRFQMYFATVVVTVGIILIYLKSRSKLRLRRRWFIAVIFFIIGIVSLIAMAFLYLETGFKLRRNLNLERAQLTEAILTNVDLSMANMRDADLRGADLRRAFMWDADLSRANLSRANLVGAYLNGVKLNNTIIDDTTQLDQKWQLVWELVNKREKNRNLQKVDLSGACLRDADLRGADLSDAKLSEANLSRAYMYQANLSRAMLLGANLNGANLDEANLNGATLNTAVLLGASLSRADLRGADLRGTIYLSVNRLCEANTLYESKLDSDLEKQVKEQCPDLLKEQKE